jgi:hypothetical protein
MAITSKISAGAVVHIISMNVLCVKEEEIGFRVCPKCHKVRINIQVTKIAIIHKKNIRS